MIALPGAKLSSSLAVTTTARGPAAGGGDPELPGPGPDLEIRETARIGVDRGGEDREVLLAHDDHRAGRARLCQLDGGAAGEGRGNLQRALAVAGAGRRAFQVGPCGQPHQEDGERGEEHDQDHQPGAATPDQTALTGAAGAEAPAHLIRKKRKKLVPAITAHTTIPTRASSRNGEPLPFGCGVTVVLDVVGGMLGAVGRGRSAPHTGSEPRWEPWWGSGAGAGWGWEWGRGWGWRSGEAGSSAGQGEARAAGRGRRGAGGVRRGWDRTHRDREAGAEQPAPTSQAATRHSASPRARRRPSRPSVARLRLAGLRASRRTALRSRSGAAVGTPPPTEGFGGRGGIRVAQFGRYRAPGPPRASPHRLRPPIRSRANAYHRSGRWPRGPRSTPDTWPLTR